MATWSEFSDMGLDGLELNSINPQAPSNLREAAGDVKNKPTQPIDLIFNDAYLIIKKYPRIKYRIFMWKL